MQKQVRKRIESLRNNIIIMIIIKIISSSLKIMMMVTCKDMQRELEGELRVLWKPKSGSSGQRTQPVVKNIQISSSFS